MSFCSGLRLPNAKLSLSVGNSGPLSLARGAASSAAGQLNVGSMKAVRFKDHSVSSVPLLMKMQRSSVPLGSCQDGICSLAAADLINFSIEFSLGLAFRQGPVCQMLVGMKLFVSQQASTLKGARARRDDLNQCRLEVCSSQPRMWGRHLQVGGTCISCCTPSPPQRSLSKRTLHNHAFSGYSPRSSRYGQGLYVERQRKPTSV